MWPLHRDAVHRVYLLPVEVRCYISCFRCLARNTGCNTMSYLTADAVSFVHVSRETPDVTPCRTSPLQGVLMSADLGAAPIFDCSAPRSLFGLRFLRTLYCHWVSLSLGSPMSIVWLCACPVPPDPLSSHVSKRVPFGHSCSGRGVAILTSTHMARNNTQILIKKHRSRRRADTSVDKTYASWQTGKLSLSLSLSLSLPLPLPLPLSLHLTPSHSFTLSLYVRVSLILSHSLSPSLYDTPVSVKGTFLRKRKPLGK